MIKLLLLSIMLCGCGSNLLSDEQAGEGDLYVGEPATGHYLPAEWTYINIADDQQTIYIVNYSQSMLVMGNKNLSVSYQVGWVHKAAATNGEGNFHIPKEFTLLRIESPTNVYTLFKGELFAVHQTIIHYGYEGILINSEITSEDFD